MNNITGRAFRPIAMVFSLTAIFACADSKSVGTNAAGQNSQGVAQSVVGAATHVWYAFTQDGYAEVDFPSRAPKVNFAPWTETARVCDAAMLGNGARGAFFLVNRLGMLAFLGDGSISLARDVSYFSDSTVGSLMIVEDAPVFHHYANGIFNSDSAPLNTIIIRFDPSSCLFYPAFLKRDARLEARDEVSALSLFEGEWFLQIKRFNRDLPPDYRAFSFLESLANPAVQKKVVEREITQEDFRRALESESYDNAPTRIKNLLPLVPSGVPFYLECRFQDAASPKRFSAGAALHEKAAWKEVNGSAVAADTYVAALFEDGTVYFQGALTGYPICKNNEVVVFKLPPLPAGFAYGKCVVSGGKLFASWEETRFYETARSGFIQVNLDTLLYESH